MTRKVFRLELDKAEIAIKKQHEFRGGRYQVLEILNEKKMAFEIDSRDGISLESIANFIENFQNSHLGT